MDRTTVTAWREKILHACGLDEAAVRRIMASEVVAYLCKAHMPPESLRTVTSAVFQAGLCHCRLVTGQVLALVHVK